MKEKIKDRTNFSIFWLVLSCLIFVTVTIWHIKKLGWAVLCTLGTKEERCDRSWISSLSLLLPGSSELQADLGSWIRTSGVDGLEHSLWSGAQCGFRALSYFCRVSIMKEMCGMVLTFSRFTTCKTGFHCVKFIYDKFWIQLETAKLTKFWPYLEIKFNSTSSMLTTFQNKIYE